MRGYGVTVALLSGLLAGVGVASGQEAADGLSDQERDSLSAACSRAGLLGSAALERCEARHLANLQRVPRPAGISGLSDADSATLAAACAEASRVGPAELRRCQTRQLAAISPQQAPAPDIDDPAIASAGAAPPAPVLPPQNELAPADVLVLQELLAAVGYDPGPADGLFGPATARAISQYEQDAGREATGRATLALLEQLRASQPEQQLARPEPEAVRPEPQIAEAEPQAAEPEPEIAEPGPQVAEVEPEIAEPGPQVAEPEPETPLLQPQIAEPAPQAVGPEPQVAEAEPEIAAPEPRIAEPAAPVPAGPPAQPDLPPDSAPDPPGEAPARSSPAPPETTVPQRAEGLSPTEIYLRSKDTVWLVIAGENMAAFENPSGLSQGAAVAVAPDRLLTNCHVIDGLEIISIWQGDFFASAELLDADYESDRCVLVPNKMELSAIADIRRYDELSVGERVFTIGSPAGLEQTLGEGVVSSLRVDEGIPVIEATAPISPGSSGGGLFDDQGKLIGITTFLLEDGKTVTFSIAAGSFGSE